MPQDRPVTLGPGNRAPRIPDSFLTFHKPKHSGFFSTTLDVLLDYLKARTLIITGIAGNICVLFTANDAYMRDFHLYVPSDCVASNDPEDNRHALEQIRTVLKADITPSTALDLEAIKRCSAATGGERRRPRPQQGALYAGWR